MKLKITLETCFEVLNGKEIVQYFAVYLEDSVTDDGSFYCSKFNSDDGDVVDLEMEKSRALDAAKLSKKILEKVMPFNFTIVEKRHCSGSYDENGNHIVID